MPEKQPAWIAPLLVLICALVLLPASLIYYARATHSAVPRLSIIPDMDKQEKVKTQTENDLFADHRAMRLPPSGTVARGETALDTHLNLGQVGGTWATTMPMPVTPELMRRGQERYMIYCWPCHGASGSSDGPVDMTGDLLAEGTWIPPVTYHSPLVRSRPVGHIFNTITNGIRNMPSYGTQIPVADRWAIVAYVRALQRSQYASLADVPVEERQALINQAAAEAQGQTAPANTPPQQIAPGSGTPPKAAGGGK